MRQMDSLKLSKISQDSNSLLKKNDLMDSTNIWQTYASLFLAHYVWVLNVKCSTTTNNNNNNNNNCYYYLI